MLPSITTLAQVALILLSPSVYAASVSTLDRRATTCNGFSELCDRSYGNVTFVGAHDSYAVGVNNLATNQDYNVTQQLNDGVRLLQMQAHNFTGTIQLCHTSCSLFNGGPLQSYLESVKSWMDSNTNDVVTLLIVNSDGFLPTAYDSVFKATGLDVLSYAPSTATLPAGSWPNLGDLVDSGKRLITLMDAGADFNSVPYIIDEFTNVWETAFDVTDTTFDCNVNRTKGDPTTQLYAINHFLDKIVFGQPAPNQDAANVTNAVSGVGSLGQQVNTCVAANGRNPNFMLVDFYEYGGGSVFQVAATANGVTYNPSTPVPPPRTSSGSATPSTSSSSNPSKALSLHQITGIDLAVWATVSAGLFIGAWSIL